MVRSSRRLGIGVIFIAGKVLIVTNDHVSDISEVTVLSVVTENPERIC